MFDARCLPNPYWDASLRHLTGKDSAVVEFLGSHPDVEAMLVDIKQFLQRWLPSYEASNRSYMTIAVGCTGGQHRSVYLCERLYKDFAGQINNLQLLHRELSRPESGKVQHD